MMKKLLSILAISMALACQSHAGFYDLTFTQTGGPTPDFPILTNAVGQLEVVNGFAISGFLNVTSGPGAPISLTLVGDSGNNGYFLWDSVVNVGSNPFLTTTGGLEFVNGNTQFNMWADGPGVYELWGNIPGDGQTSAYGNNYKPAAMGTATLTEAVPESSATVAMLGAALMGLVAVRRRFAS